MNRDASIPLFLWITTAITFHAMGGGGAVTATRFAEELKKERDEIRGLVLGVRDSIGGRVTEVEITDTVVPAQPDPLKSDAEEVEGEDGDPVTAEELEKKKLEAEKKKEEAIEKKEEPKVEPPLPTPPPEPKKEEPPPPKPKEEEIVKVKPIDLEALKKLAVRQEVDKKQPDNPDANRIAPDANRVDKETMAKNRSLDQDSKDPTFGTNAKGPADKEGNSENQKLAQSEEKKGDEKRAPGEDKDKSSESKHEAPKPAEAPTVARSSAQGGPGQKLRDPAHESAGSLGGAGSPSPEVAISGNGSWSLDPANPGGNGASKTPGQKKRSSPRVPNVRAMGLGIAGTPGGPPNLDFLGFEKAMGEERLARERSAVGAAIRTEHRGRFDTNKFEKWRPAIENYDPSVELGNQTALNAAASPFAAYLHDIHNRLHPIFGDEFLGAGMASAAGLNDMNMVAHVEVVLSRSEGKILRMGVVRQSGSTMFDAVALESLDRASPFGKAPEAIVSPDGNVYLHWEFHRDPVDACSTKNARPIMLKNPPKLVPNMPRRGTPTVRPGKPPAEGGPLLPMRPKRDGK